MRFSTRLRSCHPPPFVAQRLDVVVKHLGPHRQCHRWLGVGFGVGLLLQAARRGGWNVAGVEAATPAFELMRDKGFNVHLGGINEWGLSVGSFDVVSMVEATEHVDDPVSLVAEAGRLPRPGGALYLTTPNIGSLPYRVLARSWSVVTPPHHLQLYWKTGMNAMPVRAGFETIEVEWVGIDPGEFISALPGCRPISSKKRVESAHRLNRTVLSSPFKRELSGPLNRTLSDSGTGDTLKAVARNGFRMEPATPSAPSSVQDGTKLRRPSGHRRNSGYCPNFSGGSVAAHGTSRTSALSRVPRDRSL